MKSARGVSSGARPVVTEQDSTAARVPQHPWLVDAIWSQPEPFADWAEPDEILFQRRERCRRCPGRVLVGYVLDHNGMSYGWGARPLDDCSRPDERGEKVLGVEPCEILL